jgi:hypothetical protein
MPELDQIIQLNQTVAADILARARAIPADRWTVPRAPGKWSPGQVVEHVVKSWEGHRYLVTHETALSPFGKLRGWAARTFFLPKLFAAGDFTQEGLKSPKFILPNDVPAPQADLLPRLEKAANGLNEDLGKARAAGREKITHSLFGPLPLADFLHFVAIHNRHHAPQIVASS